MLWSARTHGCSLGERQNSDQRPVPPPPLKEATQTAQSDSPPEAAKTEPVNMATSDFDRWFQTVKTGGDDSIHECVREEDSLEEEHEDIEEFEDTDVEEQLADGEQITCAGCGRQLPKGAMWCPKCNQQPE